MNYTEAVEYCESFANNKSSMSLENISKILKILGNPEEDCKYIHVAGTNGKGSVVSYISEVLQEAGYITGKYTSPHLNKINERISINGKNISDEDFACCMQEVKKALDGCIDIAEHFTMFELITCAAFLHFSKSHCDICVLETGLGGRLDATNVVKKPLVTVITKIGYDHMSYLGDRIEDIAKEKAGIMKTKSPCVIAPQCYDSIYRVFDGQSKEKQCKVNYVDKNQIRIFAQNKFEQSFKYGDMNDLKITLLGEHQVENAATAIETINQLREYNINVPGNAIRTGLYNTKWPCRMELVHDEPVTIIDGAHNPDGVKALVSFLDKTFNNRKITYIFGVMKDKNYHEMISLIKPNAKVVYGVKVNNSRALEPEALCSELNAAGVDAHPYQSVHEAIDRCFSEKDSIICIFGSLYMTSDARKYVISEKK